MSKIYLSADIREINSFNFTVEVDDNLPITKAVEVAKDKLKAHLDVQCPNPLQSSPDKNGIHCYDCEGSVETEDTVSIDVNNTLHKIQSITTK